MLAPHDTHKFPDLYYRDINPQEVVREDFKYPAQTSTTQQRPIHTKKRRSSVLSARSPRSRPLSMSTSSFSCNPSQKKGKSGKKSASGLAGLRQWLRWIAGLRGAAGSSKRVSVCAAAAKPAAASMPALVSG
jgi:hypothetical protein